MKKNKKVVIVKGAKKVGKVKKAKGTQQEVSIDLGINKLSQRSHKSLRNILSNLRFSLTFRIALHYAWQLLRTTFSHILIMTLFFMLAQMPGMSRTIHRIHALEPGNGTYYTAQQIEEHGVTAYRRPAPPIDTGWDRVWQQVQVAFGDELFQWPPVLVISTTSNGQALYTCFNLTSRLEVYFILVLGFIFSDLIRVMGFLRKRNRLNKSVLQPIRDITDMAATLSASNLSNRINIAGTKNELKDLAVVINSMLDRIERSYNSQKQFVSDASHELRTPIAVIQGYVNMLNRWGKEDRSVLEEGINAITQETESMKNLVESLLFLARHDKKTLLLEMETFDPCEVMASLHREAGLVMPKHIFVLKPMQHTLIQADKNMVKQVMRILSDNAVKYTPPGGTITLEAGATATGCALTVTDTGPGIPNKELYRIFDRFYRLDSARKSESGGHGLGLSIARIIVIAHGGKITVKSKVGQGTSFTVYLPSKQSN